MKIFATGTLRSTRSGVPDDVKRLITVMKGNQVPRGTEYYIREPSSSDVYSVGEIMTVGQYFLIHTQATPMVQQDEPAKTQVGPILC